MAAVNESGPKPTGLIDDLRTPIPDVDYDSTRFNPDGSLIDPAGELERVKTEFDDYFADAEVGSSKALALFDHIEWVKAHQTLYFYRANVAALKDPDSDLNPTKYAHPLEYRSGLRIAEQMIVGVELRIQDNTASVPGYYLHQTNLRDMLEGLDAVISDYNVGKSEEEMDYTEPFEYAQQTLEKILTQAK